MTDEQKRIYSTVATMLRDDKNTPKPGDTFLHYKGERYEVAAVCIAESDQTPFVAYLPVPCPPNITFPFIRSIHEFMGEATVVNPDGTTRTMPRFTRVRDQGIANQRGRTTTLAGRDEQRGL